MTPLPPRPLLVLSYYLVTMHWVPASSLDAPSPSIPVPIHINKSVSDVALLDNSTFVPAPLHPDRQIATHTESIRDSATSLDPSAAAVARNTSARTRPPAIHETLTSSSSVPPTGKLSLGNNEDSLVHSGALEIHSSPSLKLVVNDITGPSLFTTPLLSQVSLYDAR
jgi:hypothetical protein